MNIVRWLVVCCGALLMASGTAAAWAGPSLVQCNGIKDLVFIPHQDDDLLFMNPDIESAVDAGGCLQLVYLTASERGEGAGYMLGRERGVQAAYAYMAQVADIWKEGASLFGARHLTRFTLNGQPRISLLAMRLEDPWLGNGWGSLTPLSQAESIEGKTVQSLGPYVENYTRTQLVATLAAIISDYEPTTIRHMDDTITIPYQSLCWRCIGHDHPDHIASARLVRDAMKMAQGNYAEVAYVDYPSQERDTNLTATETAEKADAFKRYAWHDYRYCIDPALCQEPAGPAALWVSRTYYVSRHDAPPIMLPGSNGSYSLFTVGEHNRAANVWHSHSQQWTSLGGRTADHIVAFDLDDNRAGIFARDATGRVWATIQNQKKDWDTWQVLKGAHVTRLPSVTSQGHPAAIAMGNNGLFHYVSQTDGGRTWSRWTELPLLPNTLNAATIARDNAGNLVVFAADSLGKLWKSSLAAVTPGTVHKILSWTAWQTIAAVNTSGGLAAMRNASGQIELFLRDKLSDHMLHMTQLGSDGPQELWSPPVDLSFPYTGQPAIGFDEKDVVVVAALERSGGSVWLVEGNHATRLPGNAASTPALRTVNGSLYVVARSTHPDQNYWVAARTGGVWITPVLIKAPPASGGAAFNATRTIALVPITPE